MLSKTIVISDWEIPTSFGIDQDFFRTSKSIFQLRMWTERIDDTDGIKNISWSISGERNGSIVVCRYNIPYKDESTLEEITRDLNRVWKTYLQDQDILYIVQSVG